MLNLHRLFSTVTATNTFLDAITPTNRQQAALETAKNIIRDFLRTEVETATVSELGLSKAVTPRFRTQGSWSYGTCVQPAWQQQQMDWDFGIYLPVSVWESNGPPRAMAKRYFDLVEKRLAKLCERLGWRMLPGKATCIRVEISSFAHIDVPLYAAPEREFLLIYERMLKASRARADSAVALDSAEQEWADLKQIVLATREGEWKNSDPQKVSRWFRDRIAEHHDQLQRICMYLKAWRDFHWPNGDGPTSVCIMVAVAEAFIVYPRRDDLALEAAASVLSRALIGEIRCDGIDRGEEDFNRRLTAEDKAEASGKAATLSSALKRARHLSSSSLSEQQAIQILIEQLGSRVPNDRSLVDSDGGEDVRATPARIVPPPAVHSTKAG